MNYKGYEIEEQMYTTQEDPYTMSFDSNEFDLTRDDLQQLLKDLINKAEELNEKGITFKNLRYNFYAVEYSESDYGDTDASCTISFAYQRPETPEESAKRIERKKKFIDEKIEQDRRKEEAKKLVKEAEIQKAMNILQENGFNVVKK